MLLLFSLLVPNIALVREINSTVCREVWRRWQASKAQGHRIPPTDRQKPLRLCLMRFHMRDAWALGDKSGQGKWTCGGRKETQTREQRGGDLVSLLKKESQSPSWPLAHFFICSQPVSCTVIWWFYWQRLRWERTEKHVLADKPLPLIYKKKQKNPLLLLSFHNELKSFPSPSFFPLRRRRQWRETKINKITVFQPPLCVSRALEWLNQCGRQLELQRKMGHPPVCLCSFDENICTAVGAYLL